MAADVFISSTCFKRLPGAVEPAKQCGRQSAVRIDDLNDPQIRRRQRAPEPQSLLVPQPEPRLQPQLELPSQPEPKLPPQPERLFQPKPKPPPQQEPACQPKLQRQPDPWQQQERRRELADRCDVRPKERQDACYRACADPACDRDHGRDLHPSS